MIQGENKIACPICGNGRTGPAFRFPRLTIFRCRDCRHHWQQPFASAEVLDAIFQGLYRGDPRIIDDYFPEWRLFYLPGGRGQSLDYCRGILIRRMKLAERFAPAGRVLDIGCGFGRFLARARERGWEGYGVEPSSPAADYVRRELGFPVSESLPPDLSAYRLITLWDVLEHQRDPAEFLRAISATANKGSVLGVAVPARQSLPVRVAEAVFRLTRGRIDAGLSRFYVITHLHYFTRAGLTLLLEGAGYRVLLPARENTCLDQLDLSPAVKTPLRLVLGLMRLFGSGNRHLIYSVKT